MTILSRYFFVTYNVIMDSIFKALADPTRRMLLDSLRAKDGQTLQDLQGQLDMTRFGVMKHLAVLEEAKLILTKKQGRFKYHYLNVVPLQETLDRWIEPMLVKPAARAVLNLKTKLEGPTQMSKPDFMMQIFIRCTQDALWDALTDPVQMAAYHFMCNDVRLEDDTYRWVLPNGDNMFEQKPISIEPKSRIEASFVPHFMGPDAPASRSVFLIEPQGDTCKLTIEHYEMAPGQEGFAEGWARLASSLKSYLETGTGIQAAM